MDMEPTLRVITETEDVCNEENVLNCKSLKRMKSALKDLSDNLSDDNINNNDEYSESLLLNDFFHLKYDHNINKDNEQFNVVFTYLTDDNKSKCNISECKHCNRHFRDRSISQNSTSQYIIDILSRIHTYFIHSFDINRLTINEMNGIEVKLNKFKESEIKQLDQDDIDDDIDEKLINMKLQIISNIMKNKKQKSLLHCNKYTEIYNNYNYDDGDIKLMFDENNYNYNKKSKYSKEQQDKLTQFTNITAADNTKALKFLESMEWDIGSAVDRFFLYNGDISRLPRLPAIGRKMKNDEGKNDDNKDDEKHELKESQNSEIYTVGIKFWFWSSGKKEDEPEMEGGGVYIASKYDNLKEELLSNQTIKCTQSQWNILENECKCLMNTDYVKKIVSNGKNEDIYAIKSGEIFDIEHMLALKLYSEYISWCNIFCNAFRINPDNNETLNDLKEKMREFVCWSKLLTECVQCYGNLLVDDTISFYRAINGEYKFSKFVAIFNVPMSTCTEIQIAQQFVDDNGIIMELGKYKENTVFYFKCNGISCFDTEEEALFFGGDTVLKLQSIYHNIDSFMNYKYYVEAIHNILKLVDGLKIDKKTMSKYGKERMRNILKHILRTTNYRISDLPEYIDKLITYHLNNISEKIRYDFNDLISNYEWLHEIFIKDKEENILNISSICNLFKKCKIIEIMMPNDFIINDKFCISLIEDIENIANDITLMFKWCQPMLLNNHSNIEEFRREFSSFNWQLHFSSNLIKFTNITHLFDENEIARQQDILHKIYKKNRLNNYNNYTIFDSLEEKIPLLIDGYIRENCNDLTIPMDIINLTILMYGNHHTIYWKLNGVKFWNLIDEESEDDDLSELVSEPYTIHIMDYLIKFQLKIKTESDGSDTAIILSLHAITDDINKKQAITVQYTMICEETKCEYRHMDVIGDGDGSGWFEDFLHCQEIKKLNLREINFLCEIDVLHIWSQNEDENEEIELMSIYHSGSKMQQKYQFKWELNQYIIPSNVTKEYTMWYSPRFDNKNWTAVFVERSEDFLIALKSLSLPFGIGVLIVQCQIIVHNNNNNKKETVVTDTMVEQFKYGDDDKNMAETKEWTKEELFGQQWMNDFSLSQLTIDIKLEILHIEGINEEQIFRINWPLYGIMCDDEKRFKKNNFVITKEQFENETFGFNYMIGMLQNKINDLQKQINDNKKNNNNNNGYIVNNEDDAKELKQWLSTTVQLPNYYQLFMQNGFNSLEMIKEINDKNDLQYIGIEIKAHQIKLINKINILKQ